MEVGLRYEQRIAGIIALSTYLHDAAATEQERTDANLALPIFMGHGTADPMITIMRAATSRENLIRLAYDIEWHDYPMGHQVCIEEIEDIARFIRRAFDAQNRFSTRLAGGSTWSFDEFLLDHAANERKASAMAMSMVAHYPDRPRLVTEMIDLALEEMNHFRQVYRLIEARGLC